MGPHNPDHEDNKITQEHWRDLISTRAEETRINTHTRTCMHSESPAPAHVCAIMIVKITNMSGTGFHPHLGF